MYKEVNIPKYTGRWILNLTISQQTGKFREEQPYKISNKVIKEMIAFITKDYNYRISKWEDLRKRFCFQVK